MNCYDARDYDEVKIIDNDYVERLMKKFDTEHIPVRIETHPTIYSVIETSETIPIFTTRFYIQKVNKTSNEITCVGKTRSGKLFKAIVPVECVEFVKKNNFFKRWSLKKKFADV